jgi:hypothetical protein
VELVVVKAAIGWMRVLVDTLRPTMKQTTDPGLLSPLFIIRDRLIAIIQ